MHKLILQTRWNLVFMQIVFIVTAVIRDQTRSNFKMLKGLIHITTVIKAGIYIEMDTQCVRSIQ